MITDAESDYCSDGGADDGVLHAVAV